MPLRRTSLAAIHFPCVHARTAAAELAPVDVTGKRAGSDRSGSVQVGTFRDLAPLDLPQTSNVVTREVLDAQAASGLFDALRHTAGVTRSQLSGLTYDNIAIRGILVENRGNYRLNGSLPIINLIDVRLENKERVEVLKAASSLDYGFVPPSGIVNLVTKRAGRQDVTDFTVTANQYGGASLHADIGRRRCRRSGSAASATPIGVAQNLYDPVAIARLSPACTVASTGSGIRDAGWCLSDRIRISERWQAMAGLRSGSDRSTSTSARDRADDLTPSLSLIFKPDPRTSVHASYIEGLTESGQAPLNRANAGEWAVLDNATDRNCRSTAGNGYIGVGAPRTLKLLARVSF
jgi:outer membrane receptor protein involved in Fe transport